ncbi:hypothetical protein BDR26DRAFT_273036 [Obelidium mucronatum]|nr:hypothetical protein BDR26DRAFT_273036 [Obelidium mucronatum]
MQTSVQAGPSTSRSLVAAYSLRLLIGIVQRIAPLVLVACAVGLLLLTVPLSVAISPALFVVASPVIALLALFALILGLLRTSFGESWRKTVDWLIPTQGLYAYAKSWIPSFLLPKQEPAISSSTLSNVEELESIHHDGSRIQSVNQPINSPHPHDDHQRMHQHQRQQQEPLLHNQPPKMRNVLQTTPPITNTTRVIFKDLNPSTDAPLLSLCTSLYQSTIPGGNNNGNTNTNNTTNNNSPPPIPQRPLVRLGKSDAHGIEFHVLSVWTRDAKEYLLAKEYSKLRGSDLVTFVEYMHPIQSPSTLRIEKLATNYLYQKQQPPFSQRVIQEMQGMAGVKSIGVWCLTGVESFYEALGFRRVRDGEKGPWMMWDKL